MKRSLKGLFATPIKFNDTAADTFSPFSPFSHLSKWKGYFIETKLVLHLKIICIVCNLLTEMLKVLSGFFWLYIILLTEIMTRWLGFEWTSSPLFWRQNSGMNEMLSVPGPKKICINYYINMASGYRSYFHISFSILFFFKVRKWFCF